MKKFLDANHPFFARAWVRWLTVLVCLGMALVETAAGNAGWAVLFAAAGVYAFYVLIWLGPSSG